jgi:hypothetical protein
LKIASNREKVKGKRAKEDKITLSLFPFSQ